jgi:glycosyltransferase involved in cell wall biosynthesis
MTPEFKTAALVIPAYNEEAVILSTLERIPSNLVALVVVVDNGSTDRTAELAARAGATVIRTAERGYGVACLAALRALPAEVEVLVFMQADLSENPGEARLLLSPIYEGRADMVLGSRTLGPNERGSLLPHQRFGNWLATRLIRLLFGYRYTDLGPFRAIRRDALEALALTERRYGWTVEMQIRALQEKLRILELPVSYAKRVAGENKVSGSLKASILAGTRIIWTVLRLWLRSVSRPESQPLSWHRGSCPRR